MGYHIRVRLNARRSQRQRAQLDARLAGLRPLGALEPPRRGWLKAVRESLGMSAAQLGKRLGISAPNVLKLEANEIRRALTLGSLERAAEAMGCRLVYALVPEESLEAQVDAQAQRVARERLARSEHSMLLEDQAVPPELQELQLRELANELKAKLGPALWGEP